MSDYKPKQANVNEWTELATKQMKGKSPDQLTWNTPEGIDIKALYTAEDLEGLEFSNTMPGIEPFVRGPQSTMYAGPPLDYPPSMRASPPPKNPTPFTAKHSPLVARVCRWLLT